MGAVQSTLTTLQMAVKLFLQLMRDADRVLQKTKAAPGIPIPNPSESYWLEDPPYPELCNTQSPELPEHADVVIIGSGITGAAVARSILLESEAKGRRPRVVVLEARSICSGATGRNGGHINASPLEGFSLLKDLHSPERVAALVRYQLSHLQYLTELCREEGWDIAECREVETLDMFLDETARDEAFKESKEVGKWFPGHETLLDGPSVQEKYGVNNKVVGAILRKAGAIWPYRFVSCVWHDLLVKFPKSLSIETNTAVLGIETDAKGTSPYQVRTGRGLIYCNHVVHATNAFASQFVPGLRGKMTGFLAHMSAQRPGKKFPNYDGSVSWGLAGPGLYDYITQRPTINGVAGDLMIGGGFSNSKEHGMDMIGVYDDSKVDALTVSHINGIFDVIYSPNWGEDAEGGRMKKAWSGIVSMTGDTKPWVGRLDAKLTGRRISKATEDGGMARPGEWISASYTGNGMVWAWLSGTALGIMIAGSEEEDLPKIPGRPEGKLKDWFPEELLPTLRRVREADLQALFDKML